MSCNHGQESNGRRGLNGACILKPPESEVEEATLSRLAAIYLGPLPEFISCEIMIIM